MRIGTLEVHYLSPEMRIEGHLLYSTGRLPKILLISNKPKFDLNLVFVYKQAFTTNESSCCDWNNRKYYGYHRKGCFENSPGESLPFVAFGLNLKPHKGIWRMQKKSTVTDILVSNLAFADFLFTAFCIWLKMR